MAINRVILKAPQNVAECLSGSGEFYPAEFSCFVENLGISIEDDANSSGLCFAIYGKFGNFRQFLLTRLKAVNQFLRLYDYQLQLEERESSNFYLISIKGFKKEKVVSVPTEEMIFEITKHRFEFFISLFPAGHTIRQPQLVENIKKYEKKIYDLECESLKQQILESEVSLPEFVEAKFFSGKNLKLDYKTFNMLRFTNTLQSYNNFLNANISHGRPSADGMFGQSQQQNNSLRFQPYSAQATRRISHHDNPSRPSNTYTKT